MKDEKGYLLPAAFGVFLILALLVTGASTAALSDITQSKWMRDRTAAFYLAESGISDVMYRLMEKNEALIERDYYANPRPAPSYISEGQYSFGDGKKFEVWVKKLVLINTKWYLLVM